MSLIYSLYVINKSGGLIYSKVGLYPERGEVLCWARPHTLSGRPLLLANPVCLLAAAHCCWQEFEPAARLDLNDTLRLASIWCVSNWLAGW